MYNYVYVIYAFVKFLNKPPVINCLSENAASITLFYNGLAPRILFGHEHKPVLDSLSDAILTIPA